MSRPRDDQRSELYELSVVVALTAADPDCLRECLASLHGACQGISAQVLVPYDKRLSQVEALKRDFPDILFGDREKRVPAGTPAYHHLRVDILRAEGLSASRGRIVALVEDCAVVSRGWAAAILNAHESSSEAIGGPIENGLSSALSEAVYLCDFSPYAPPGARLAASDANVSYKREALRGTRRLWGNVYDEQTLHRELRSQGKRISCAPNALLYQKRRGMRLPDQIRQRFHWGAWYGKQRLANMTAAGRALYFLAGPVLPVVATTKVLARSLVRRRWRAFQPSVLILIALLQSVWILGEWTSYADLRAAR